MFPAPTTTTVLLTQLRDADDHRAWNEFHQRYMPIILGVARQLGLDEHDAADVAQDTLSRFVVEYRLGRYDRQRGRLRAWIVAIVRYRVIDLFRERGRRREIAAGSGPLDVPDEHRLTEMWEQEHRRVLLARAMEELRRSTRIGDRALQAFQQFVVEQRAAADVAAALDMSTADVYVAKNRIANRLRAIVQQLEAQYDESAP